MRTRASPSADSSVLVCQRCQKGIIIDESLEAIDESVFANSVTDRELNSKNEVLSALWELASDSSQIDHPLCSECSQLVTFEMHKQLADLEQENDRYSQFLLQLNENDNEDVDNNLDKKIEEVGGNNKTNNKYLIIYF